jgi:hypothetical protein
MDRYMLVARQTLTAEGWAKAVTKIARVNGWLLVLLRTPLHPLLLVLRRSNEHSPTPRLY